MARALPKALPLECPHCGRQLHDIIKGQWRRTGSSNILSATVRCQRCEHVRREEIEQVLPRKIPLIRSTGKTSQRHEASIPATQLLVVGEEFDHPALGRMVLTALETRQGRPPHAPAGEVLAIWAKDFGTVAIPVSVGQVQTTRTEQLRVAPEEMFFIGQQLALAMGPVEVHAIRTKGLQTVEAGSVPAVQVARLYAHVPRPPSARGRAPPYRRRSETDAARRPRRNATPRDGPARPGRVDRAPPASEEGQSRPPRNRRDGPPRRGRPERRRRHAS